MGFLRDEVAKAKGDSMWVQSSCSNHTLFRAEHIDGSDSLAMICRKHRWLLCLLLVGLLTVSEACENKSVAAAPAPPPTVQVVEVAQRDVPVYHEWIATLDGFVNAIIQPQVSGYLVQQNYREGALVRKNDVLFKIDPRPFQAILDQAKAQVAQAEAQLGKTQLDVQRDTPLAKEKAIAQSQLDNDIQANLAAKAIVQAGKAAVEQAEINLEFTNVRSLVDGVAGIATGQVGNLVGPQTVLTTVFHPAFCQTKIRDTSTLICSCLACIIHQRWKVSRTVVGIEDDRQGVRQIWDRARAREVASDSEGILRQGFARNCRERVSSKPDERLSWCRQVGRQFETETGKASRRGSRGLDPGASRRR